MPEHESLALLYQGVITGIVRVQAGRQPILDAQAFRKRMKEAFLQIERAATKLNFSLEDVRQANYAVVAFLDETVLNSKDPARANWSSLQAEMSGGAAIAGDSVFDQLARLEQRPDSPELAELLEVNGLCLLLGYQGRYGIESKGELDATSRRVLRRIAHIRNEDSAFSPSGLPAAAASAVAPAHAPGSSRWWLVPVVLTPVIWTIFKVNLVFSAGTIRSFVEKVLVP